MTHSLAVDDRPARTRPAPEGEAPATAAARRLGWGFADQAVSSVTNFGLAVIVARSVDPASFGAFALVFGVYALAVGTARALVTEPLAIRFSAAPPAERAAASRRAIGGSLTLGVLAGAATTLVALLAGGQLRGPLLTLGLFLPALLTQDAWRSVFLTTARPAKAFANDLVWAAVQFTALAALVSHRPSAATLLAAWGTGATLAAVAGMAQAGFRPPFGTLALWLRENRRLWPRLSVEFWMMNGVWQGTILALAVVAGLEAVGAIRGAQTVLGPLNLVFLAVPTVILPETTRLYHRQPDRLLVACLAVGAGLAVLAALVGALALLLPNDIGRHVLGATWEDSRSVMLPMTVFIASTGANLGALLGLRAMGATRASLRARLLVSVLVVVGGLTGGTVAGGPGAATGLAIANWTATFVWWSALRSAYRKVGR